MKAVLYVKEGRNRTNLPFDDILYMEKFGAKVILYTENREYHTYETYCNITEMLDERFVMPHKSYIFNMDHIYSIEDNDVNIDNKACVKMGEKCIRRLRRKMDENACKY